jgi:thiol-disulfide isomerase/thioredoxin
MDLSTDEPIAPATGPSAAPPVARTDDRVWKVLAATSALVLIGFVVYVATRPHHPRAVAFPTTPAATLPLGTPAPDFSLAGLGGGPPVTLAATRGTPTVVNFFASWCPDCKAELAAFGALADRTAGQVDVIGVDANDNDGAAARALLSEAKATYPVGLDPDAKVATSYLVSALPVTYFLDRRGRVVHVALGTQTPASLAKWTDALTGSSASTGGRP